MMRIPLYFFLFILLSGCTRIPQPASYAYSEQQKMQAAQHWDILASDVANQINNQLISSDYLDKAVFVKATCGSDAVPCDQGETSQFNEGFRDLLITRLVHFGVPTSIEKKLSDIEVDYKVQVIYHSTSRSSLPPGALTVLTTAVSVLRSVPGEIQAIATAVGLDIFNAAAPSVGHYEVIITTSMVADEKYLFRTSDIYYINDPDFWHYQNTSQGKTIQMVSTGR
ncbi:MAG: hypothetical protein KKD01_01480 [Proteobacteria bacterium]|nr:hypothetical protein [Pseudomonadota bacterium]MBU1417849.1 hypothetical protein [Pseudomonadota bacterium]MBU1453371.1 hypothetical protein [Pseudomonadota bacterium]